MRKKEHPLTYFTLNEIKSKSLYRVSVKFSSASHKKVDAGLKTYKGRNPIKFMPACGVKVTAYEQAS